MRISPQGIAAIAAHEAFVPGPYRDSVGVLTAYIGHTANAGAPDPASLPRGMPDDLDAALVAGFEVFARDLAKFEARVNQHVRAPLEQHEFDALVSFDFNTGGIYYRHKTTGKMVNADLVTKLNAGDLGGAAAAFMNWSKPASIVGRRKAEQRLFQLGAYPNEPMTVWGVTEAYKVVWKPVRTLSPAEVLAMAEAARGPVEPPLPRPETPAENEAMAWAEWIDQAPPGTLDWLRAMPVRA